MRSIESINYARNFLLRYKNYIALLVASLCIWRWYWISDTIGMHDAWDAMHYVKTGYQSWQGGLIPLWQSFGEHKRYFFAGGEYPVLPVFSFFLTQLLSLPVWIKTHYYIYLLFGAIGMVALLEKAKAPGFLPAFFALVSFFSGRIQAFVYYQYTWVAMWSFMPWMLYFLIKSNDNWRYWIGIAITAALFIFNAPALAFIWAAGSIIIFSLCYILRDKTIFFRTILGLFAGMLFSAPILLPILTYNWQGTVGRMAKPLHGYFDLHQLLTAFIGRFNQHRVIDFIDLNRPLMWQEFYSYIGIIPVFLILLGLIVTIYRFCKWRLRSGMALYSFLVAFAILLISCGSILRIIDHFHIPFAGATPFPHRMTVAAIFWSSVGASSALFAFWNNVRPNIRHLLTGLTLAALIFITVDYTMLFRQIDAEFHGSLERKMTAKDLNDPQWLAHETLAVQWDNKDAKLATQLLVPGNGLYFLASCDRETAVWFPDLEESFARRYLRIRKVPGGEIRKEGSRFMLPAGEYCYRLYLKDIFIYLGVLISCLTIVLLVLTKDRLDIFLKSKETGIFKA